MRNVLIITAFFPPVGGVSVQRSVKLVKYLPPFGWNPIVLTTRKDKHAKIFMPLDYSLCYDIPKNTVIYETRDLLSWLLYPLLCIVEKELKGHRFWKYIGATRILKYIPRILKRLAFPDGYGFIGWYPFAIIKSKHIMNTHNIDMIYSTSPSTVTHLIALKLAKKYNLPWVADFRDPWAYFYSDRLIQPMKSLNIKLEKKVLARANRFVIALPKIIDEFKTLKKGFNPTQCSLIYNGYDEEDFKDISPHIFEQFTIVYTGQTYGVRRSPVHLFAALNFLFQEHPDLKTKIKTLFIGVIGAKFPLMAELVKDYHLEGNIELMGHLEHKKALSYMCGASVLFLVTERRKDTKRPFQGKDVIPAKLYEYLRAKRPILALVPLDSDCARIIQDARAGVVVEPTHHHKAKEVILDMYEKYRKGELKLESDDGFIRQYERKALTAKFAKIFDDLLSEREKLKQENKCGF